MNNNELAISSFNRENCKTGIVHLGVGNFHKAHQANYINEYLNTSNKLNWGICGIRIAYPKNACLGLTQSSVQVQGSIFYSPITPTLKLLFITLTGLSCSVGIPMGANFVFLSPTLPLLLLYLISLIPKAWRNFTADPFILPAGSVASMEFALIADPR